MYSGSICDLFLNVHSLNVQRAAVVEVLKVFLNLIYYNSFHTWFIIGQKFFHNCVFKIKLFQELSVKAIIIFKIK